MLVLCSLFSKEYPVSRGVCVVVVVVVFIAAVK